MFFSTAFVMSSCTDVVHSTPNDLPARVSLYVMFFFHSFFFLLLFSFWRHSLQNNNRGGYNKGDVDASAAGDNANKQYDMVRSIQQNINKSTFIKIKVTKIATLLFSLSLSPSFTVLFIAYTTA